MIWHPHLPPGVLHHHLQEIVQVAGLLTADIAHVKGIAGTMTDLADALVIRETNLTSRDMIEGTGIIADGMIGATHLVTMTVMVVGATGKLPPHPLHRLPSSMSSLVMLLFSKLTYVDQTRISYIRDPC